MANVKRRIDKILNDESISETNREYLQNYYTESFVIKKQRIKTVYNKLYVVQKFTKFIKNKNLKDVTKKDIKRFIATQQHLALSSQNAYLGALSTFFKIVYNYDNDEDEAIIPKCVSWVKAKPIKTKVKEDDLPTLKEVEAILAADTDLRSQTIIALFFDSGGRLGEITNLNRGDVKNNNTVIQDGVELFLNARDESTKKMQRRVALSVSLKYLKHYLNYYDSTYCRNGENPNDMPLFFSTRGKTKGERLKEESIYDVVKTAAKLAKEKGTIRQDLNIHPHIFKHTHVTMMLRNPHMSDQIIKKRVGWTQNSGMLNHYSHISDNDATIAYYQSQGLQITDEIEYEYSLKGWNCIRCGSENPDSNSTCAICLTSKDADPEEGKALKAELEAMKLEKIIDEKRNEIDALFAELQKPFDARLHNLQFRLDFQKDNLEFEVDEAKCQKIKGFIESIEEEIFLIETHLMKLDVPYKDEIAKLENQGAEYNLPSENQILEFTELISPTTQTVNTPQIAG